MAGLLRPVFVLVERGMGSRVYRMRYRPAAHLLVNLPVLRLGIYADQAERVSRCKRFRLYAANMVNVCNMIYRERWRVVRSIIRVWYGTRLPFYLGRTMYIIINLRRDIFLHKILVNITVSLARFLQRPWMLARMVLGYSFRVYRRFFIMTRTILPTETVLHVPAMVMMILILF
jgi:hypothetical protein